MPTSASQTDPTKKFASDGFPRQETTQPGLTGDITPTPDHGEHSYRGTGQLTDRVALITGGDSGIGRAVAIAFAREGADVAISYLPEEHEDAEETARWVRDAGRTVLLLPGDVRDEDHNARLVEDTVEKLGKLDILVLNAAYQYNREGIETLATKEFDRTFKTNLYGAIWATRAAVPHLAPGSSIITTSSIQGYSPAPALLDYAMTKAALVAFTHALAEELADKGIRVNSVAPGPIWTPLIPATGWPDKVEEFGNDTPLGRAGQPAEVAPSYVFLASQASSYISGAVVPVTGGKHL